ncbi:(4Fe-4S)-binding protein [Telluribacter sp. SYSU D00476]|uniref:(4Fe-4S)-binding protein n=1 Tax=Telluribacter sp. SYSU D00476 TaxID=2811430 RepID=UPI001FF32C40|nr:(4Fe-4S)-binding protein [Telluribacter sp. SYSU D00476]
MEKEITKKYSNDEVTVVWQPHKCIHSERCFTGLPAVFDRMKRPWISIEGADSEQIMAQIDKCPSGALSYYMNIPSVEPAAIVNHTVVEVLPKGPLLVYGNLKVKDAAGKEVERSKVTAFCRCGHSHNKPYCDGSHLKVDFEG